MSVLVQFIIALKGWQSIQAAAGPLFQGSSDLANAINPPATINLDLPFQVDPCGRLIVLQPSNPLLLVPAALEIFIVRPVWYVWLGLSLRGGK